MLQDRVAYSNFSATQGPFSLLGGYYVLTAVAGTQSGSDHMDVARLGPDGSTYIPAIAGAQTGTTSYVGGYLPPGQYEIVVSGTLTGCYAELARVPLD